MASRMIALALGIGCVAWLPSLPSLHLLFGFLLFGLCVLGTGFYIWPGAKAAWKAFFLVACVLAGLAYGTYHGQQLLLRLIPYELEGEDLRVIGRIVSLPDFSAHRGGTYRFEFVPESWPAQKPAVHDLAAKRLRLSFTPARVTTNQSEALLPAQGQRWAFLLRLKRPRSFANPGGFDYAAWLVGQGIDATGYVREAVLLEEDTGPSLRSLRARVVHGLRHTLGDSPRYSQGAILLALAAGDRSYLSDRHWDQFRLSGTSHLMAISGLHIGIAAGLGWMLGRIVFSLLARRPLAWLPPVLALVFAGAYAWIAGFSLPTQRAFVMVGVGVIALALSRHIGRWHAWSAALLLVLALNPMATLQAGFWLSFAAVGVLLAVVERERGWRSLLVAQWVLLLGLTPFSLALFQQATLLAFPVNLVAVPLFSIVIVPLVLLALVLEVTAGVLAAPVWFLANTVLAAFMNVLDWLAVHSQFLSLDYHPSSAELFALVVLALLMSLPRAVPARYLGLLCLLPVLAGDRALLPAGEYSVKVLDVGQGLSVLVQTRHHSLVYDVGPRFSESFDMVGAAVLPVLRHSGIDYLDRVILSHGDNDHAGAWPRLLDSVAVGDMLAGADLADARPCRAGQRWRWDGVDFAILSPDHHGGGDRDGSNNRSCVLYIESGMGRALLPGDIEADVEHRILPALPQGLALLVAPHHGSKTSSSRPFVSWLKPELVVFSAGYKHHYGHPAPDVQSRYRRQGAVLASTADSGMISVVLGREGLKAVQHFRDQHRFYWNTPVE